MKTHIMILFIALLVFTNCASDYEINSQAANYVTSRKPLKENPYIELPLGAIKPQGWLKEMLIRQKNGATGNLDQLYPSVMGERNGWLGGNGDQWERGPYWIDGLLPLAYLLEDEDLINKTKPWVEWALNSRQPNGNFGPQTDYDHEPGLQRNNCLDWWPRMVVLKVLKQYYSATGDQRVIELFTEYFKYQLKTLPELPLDNWTFWARYRGGDNLMMVYWLYNITGDDSLLQLAQIIHAQTFDFTGEFARGELLSGKGTIHCVNLAQGIKEPVVYYQQSQDIKHLEAVKKAFHDIRKFHGMPHGLFGGDETLHGNNPTQGSELCTAVEMMFSLETILQITGEVDFADHLEKVAFNALPAQITDDFMNRQYFQQANQVMVTRHIRNFEIDHHGTDLCFGLLTGYPCCTANMHQGWPKFTQNLWYATPDGGLAALVYSPSMVNARVANNIPVEIVEITDYPFEEQITFKINFPENNNNVKFPLQLRIPLWCKKAVIEINNENRTEYEGNQIITIDRIWNSGDKVVLSLPMELNQSRWYENSVSIERGPLTYALKVEGSIKEVKNNIDPEIYGEKYLNVLAESNWNYGLVGTGNVDLEKVKIDIGTIRDNFPWNPENTPIKLFVQARKIPFWGLYNQMTGPLPFTTIWGIERTANSEIEEIELIPYGCTVLRISEFPLVGKHRVF